MNKLKEFVEDFKQKENCKFLTEKFATAFADEIQTVLEERSALIDKVETLHKQRDESVHSAKILREDIVEYQRVNSDLTAVNDVLRKKVANESERYKDAEGKCDEYYRLYKNYERAACELVRERDLWQQRALAKPRTDSIAVSVTCDTSRMAPVIEALQKACACVEAQPVNQPGIAAAYLALQDAIKLLVETPPSVTSKEQ